MTVELLAEVPPFRVERSSSSVRRERPVPSDATSPMIPSWAANVCEIQPPERASPPEPPKREQLCRRLLRVRLVLTLGAVADAPDVAVRVREGTAVPAPLQGGGGLEDRGTGLLGFR
jgi:hypothetical protein